MQLSAIYVYPIKSTRAVALESAEVVERGLRHDRRFMVVSDMGLMLTQRAMPELAKIAATIDDGLTIRYESSTVRVPLVPTGPRRRATVWNDDVDAIDVPGAHELLSDALGVPAHLVYMPDDAHRRHKGASVSFQDAYPLLLTNEASLADLNARMAAPLPMDRFRPNLVVRGAPAWAEDNWDHVRIGEVELDVPKPCERCAVTTIDQQTAEKGREPLATLARFRLRDGKVWFGENLVHKNFGTLRVGDSLVAQALDG